MSGKGADFIFKFALYLGKEDDIVPLQSSPEPAEMKAVRSDAFDFYCLSTITEDQVNKSPKFNLSSLHCNKTILPTHLDDTGL